MTTTRRSVLLSGVSSLIGAAALLRTTRAAAQAAEPSPGEPAPPAPTLTADGYLPVITPNGSTLEWRMVAGVKVFHLIAEPIHHVVAPGLAIEAWGYNGSTPGPTIEAVQGDRVRFYVTNRLSEPTSVHWHGVPVPNGMDGVGGLNQPPIQPGATMRYDFTLRRAATYMYHPHFDEMIQMAMGMMGMFIVHPRRPRTPRVDRDFAIMLSEWSVIPGTRRPNPMEMTDFNVLTMNSKAFPATAPLVVGRGERVRIRLGNLGATDHHPIHLHGFSFKITGTDGGPIQESAQWPENTILVPVGTTRDIEFVADVPGDWALHCHMTHHTMNQMGHDGTNTIGANGARVDRSVQRVLPDYMTMATRGMGDMAEMDMPVPENSIPMSGGRGPFGTIDMGGMFTIVKVREGRPGTRDPGFYRHPEGTVAREATADEMRDDGIHLPVPARPPAGGGHHGHGG